MLMAHLADQAGWIMAYNAAVRGLLDAADVFRTLFPNANGTQSGHAGEEGRWTESLVAEFLRKNLPAPLEVSTGFILDAERGSRSYQVDILIHDPSVAAPMLRYGDAVVVLPEAVIAAISVKHTLRRRDLAKELAELATIGEMCGSAKLPGVYTAIVAYKMDHRRVGQHGMKGGRFVVFARSISNTYLEFFNNRSKLPHRMAACEMVDSIVSLDGYLLHASTMSGDEATAAGLVKKQVSVVWGGPTGRRSYALGVELIEGVSRRFNRRAGVDGRFWPSRSGLNLSPVGRVSVAAENRAPVRLRRPRAVALSTRRKHADKEKLPILASRRPLATRGSKTSRSVAIN